MIVSLKSTLQPDGGRLLQCTLLGSVLFAAGVLIYLAYFYVDVPKIRGLPEIPHVGLLHGHLHRLGDDHATTAERWAEQHNWPVYQVRMGNRRAIILNSFDSAHAFLVKNQASTIDRPVFYTFHRVVSKTSAATIGTSPWNDRTKKQRRVVGSYTTGPAMQRWRPMMDNETYAVVSAMWRDSQKGENDIMPHDYLKRLALNTMTMFCYGTRFDSVKDPMLQQILSDANTIASFRSTNANPQDFVPHLRYIGTGDKRSALAKDVRGRRDRWLATMLDNVRDRVSSGKSANQTVSEMLLTDREESLTELDVKTVLGGLMSGGFETVFSTATIAIGVLTKPEGQRIQQRAYADIMSAYDSAETAFERCVVEEKSAYIAALVKETLRCYPPLKLLPARQTYKEFTYEGVVIPKGVLLYTNTQAISQDTSAYGADAAVFRPERWLEGHMIPAPYHFAFGAGQRMCTAVNFSNRLLYAVLSRLILSFEISESEGMPANTHYVDYKRSPSESNAMAKDFKVRLRARDERAMGRCFEKSREVAKEAGIEVDGQ